MGDNNILNQLGLEKEEQQRGREISKEEFHDRIDYYNNIKMHELSGEVEMLSKEQKMGLRRTVFNKLFMQTSTLDQFDKQKMWSFFNKSLFSTFFATGIYKVSKSTDFFGYNVSKTLPGRLFGQKFGLAVFAPLTVVVFTDFLQMSMQIGIKHRYIEENIKFIK